jgi:hypothetical protein
MAGAYDRETAPVAKKSTALTQAEKDAATAAVVAAGGKSTDPANRLPGETASQANARITAGYKDQEKPELTKEGAAAGATIEFVRTGSGGVGTYKEVFPMGTPIPTTRTTTSGNVYDEQGNLVSGSGLKTATTGTKTTTTVVNPPNPTDSGVPKAPVGTPPAYVYNATTKKWEMPPKPTTTGNWVFDANNGWVNSTINPGSSGLSAGSEKTLALDTFRNTLALLFGAKESSQPWVAALYGVASKFVNTGSTVDEAINLSLQDVRYNKELEPFTKRFNGIYALTDRLAKGEAIEVPTVAEYFKSESAIGDVLRQAGMQDLATQDFLGTVLGLGKSVAEVTTLIDDTFNRIDNAPEALKKDLQVAFPGISRTDIAKAMLMGTEGAKALNKKIEGLTVMSAAKSQGVGLDAGTAGDIAARGYDYEKSLTGFGTVKRLERGEMLGKMSGLGLSQQEAIDATFKQDVKAQDKIAKIAEEEINRFSGRSGRLASQNRSIAGLI